MMQRIINSKNLVAFVLAAATGMTLYFRVPFPEGDTFLLIMALRSPSAFEVVKYSYTLFLFSTPYIGYSVVVSGLYIFALNAKQRIRAGRLPLFPDARARDDLFLVVGEVHNPRKQVPAESPQWLVIPERGLFTGIAILGAIGSGKTSCCMYPFAEQILAYRADVYALAYNIASLLNNLFGRGKEPFWRQAYTNLVKFIILLHKVAFDYVTLFDVYECAIDNATLERKLNEAERRLTEIDFVLLWANRQLGETTQRITTAQKASSPEFQAWLRHKNANGADIYVGMNALQQHASTRTKDDIEKISHVYLDLHHGGTASIEALEKSDLVPRPTYVLNMSPEKFQIVWKVEGMTIEGAETLNQPMVREFDGDPAATDSTRVLRLPGFANKKYDSDSYVQARPESTQTYQHRDFRLQFDSQGAPRHQHEEVVRKPLTQSNTLSQSEHDWAFAKRALARGDDPEVVIRCIADYRSDDKGDPNYYSRRTVTKALVELGNRESDPAHAHRSAVQHSREPEH